MGETCKFVTGITVAIGLLLLVILVPLSLKKVEHDEYGLRWDAYNPKLHDKIYEEGRHVLAPDSNLVRFKRRFVSIEFLPPLPLECWTYDGLHMDLTIRTQYQLIKEEVVDMVKNEFSNEKSYQTYLRTVIAGSFMNSCSNYTAEDYFVRRGEIEAYMFEELKKDFVIANAHSIVGFVQLENAAHPQSFAEAVQDKQVAQQDVQKAENERDQVLIDAETRRLQAELDADIVVNQAQADASTILFKAEQDSEIIRKFWDERTEAFLNIMTGLNYNATEFVEEYLTAQVIVNVDDPIVSLD